MRELRHLAPKTCVIRTLQTITELLPCGATSARITCVGPLLVLCPARHMQREYICFLSWHSFISMLCMVHRSSPRTSSFLLN